MILYHGSQYKDLKLSTDINSRYNFPAFFLTPNRELAIMYAVHAYNTFGSGYVYQTELDESFLEIDYLGKISYSSNFRGLIHRLYKADYKSVLIKNVIDYPSEKFSYYKSSQIVIIFDTTLISSLKCIGSVNL